MRFISIILVISTVFSLSTCKITADKYVQLPKLFDLDDFDDCLMHGEKALYCSIRYELTPIDKQYPPAVWKTIKEVSADPFNYRHDWLRRGVCVTTSCPNASDVLSKEHEDLKGFVQNCYDAKFADLGLRGDITELHCETSKPFYDIDGLDIFVAIIFVLCSILVVFASFYEGIASYKSKEEYGKIVGTKFGKLMAAFSVGRNWNRLQTVKETEDVKKLKAIQGIRFYNMILVILCHTVMIEFMGPVSNLEYMETLKENFGTIFINSGGYAVQTFFLLSGWLLTYHVFLAFDGKKPFTFKHILLIFVQRYLRLTPTLIAVLALHSTWLRFVDRGPLWDELVGSAFRKCRKNWWTNLIYLNNYIDKLNMCMPHTWYLAADTQLFLCELLVLWLILKNKKYITLILSTITVIFTCIMSTIIYIGDLDPIVWPYPESLYRFGTLGIEDWHIMLSSGYSNFPGAVTGIGYGYLFYKYRNQQLFKNKITVWLWWPIILVGPLGIIIFPGLWMYSDSFVHNVWFSSFYIVLCRLIFAVCIGYLIFGMSHGIGWIAKRICEWSPTYILGRLTYSSYLIHVSLVFVRGGVRRTTVFVTDYNIICQMVGDVGLSIIAATLLTLFVEMPTSELLKMVFPTKADNGPPAGKDEAKESKSKVT